MAEFRKSFHTLLESAPQAPQSTQSVLTPPPADADRETGVEWTLYGYINDRSDAVRFTVAAQPFRVGRHPENHVCVPNSTVSGHHAELILAGDQLLLRDLNSTNGTLLNGKRVTNVEPLRDGDIVHFGNVMFRIQQEKESMSGATMVSDDVGDAIAQVQFTTLLSRPGVVPYFQPIVRLDSGERIGYEVLSRSQMMGLETPDKMFRIAAQRTSEAALSRLCRVEGMKAALRLPPGMQLYLNTHPAELNQSELFESLCELRDSNQDQQIMLEVHESGVTSMDFLKQLRKVLTDLEMQLAYDDFGSGQARLAELIEVPPDVLKFDVKLVQGLPTASESRRTTIAGLIRIVKDLNVIPLAEGVETQEEAGVCRDLGFELAQGYLFGRGEPVSKWLKE
ncbi:MAG: EAL domain-containing protein [Planctomycetaceae bacterium]